MRLTSADQTGRMPKQPGQHPIFSQRPEGNGGQATSAGAMEGRIKRLSRAATAAVAVAVLAVVFGIYALASSSAQIAQAKEGMVNVVVAAEQIDAGASITADKLKVVEVPQAYVSAGATSSSSDYVGGTAITRIDAGSQLSSSLIAASRDASSLANALNPGYKAVTISVDDVQGLAGLLKVGDTVDVLESVSDAIGGSGLERITSTAVVVALGSSLSGSESSYASVTVEVTPAEADSIRSAQANGSVTLELQPTASGKAA